MMELYGLCVQLAVLLVRRDCDESPRIDTQTPSDIKLGLARVSIRAVNDWLYVDIIPCSMLYS